MKKFFMFAIFMVMVLSISACGNSEKPQASTAPTNTIASTPGAEASATTPPIDESAAAEIVFSEQGVTSNIDTIDINENVVTIKNGGTYELSGSSENGQIIVDALDADIYFVLKGITLNCSNSAPLNIVNANNVYISLFDGSENTFSDSGKYALAAGETEPDATIFSKGDLNISGDGILNVNAVYNDAIASRDKLVVESGIININAKNHGIKGKDLLSVVGGEVNVIAGADGIKSTNTLDTAKGYVSISGGKVNVEAQDEAVSAVTYVSISGGEVNIKTANNGIKADSMVDISGGSVNIETEDKGIVSFDSKISDTAKVYVNGVEFKG